MKRFELALFEGAAGLQSLEEFLDYPPRAVMLYDRVELGLGIDWLGSEENPIDGILPPWWRWLPYVDQVELEGSFRNFRRTGAADLDGVAANGQLRHALLA